MNGPYADHILDSSDVCSNCHRQVRVERVDPVRGGLGGELDSSLERDKQRTEIGYGPADRVSDVKGVFCSCGVEGVHDRIWADDGDVDDEMFRDLLKATIRTLERKDVDIDRQALAAHALQHWRDGDGVDESLSVAVDVAIATTISSSKESDKDRRVVAGD